MSPSTSTAPAAVEQVLSPGVSVLTDNHSPNGATKLSPSTGVLSKRERSQHSRASDLARQLAHSQIFREYERAFAKATGLPLTLRPATIWSLANGDSGNGSPLCATLAKSNKTCAACLAVQEKICRPDRPRATSVICHADLCETAVPVRAGEQLVGYLQTGQVSFHRPTEARFQQVLKKLTAIGCELEPDELREAYLHGRSLPREQYTAVVHLLEIFAQHLGSVSNQLLLRQEAGDSPFSRRVKAFIAEHQSEPIHLEEAARALHVSTFYFCKMFKKATGLTFTDYLGRLRIERAKELLLNPHLRVSEIAFETGFGSLTHFNRVFRRLIGKSPSSFRQAAWRLRR